MHRRIFAGLLLVTLVVGCGPRAYPPISPEAAQTVKSGAALDEIVQSLGEPHAPTSKQARHISDVVAKMPEPMRTNAQKDKSLAWGDDKAFLVVKVNDKGTVWVTAWSSSN